MLFKPTPASKCRVVKKITGSKTFFCFKPAAVVLLMNAPEPLTLCLDCARELAKEIIDSTPGGRSDWRKKEGRR
jgi:hypothetical protein